VEQSKELHADALRADELRTANTALKISLADSNQRILQLENELRQTKAKIQGGLDTFKESTILFSFPVMQNNGHVVDFHNILSKWAKAAEDEDNTASRLFQCSIEDSYTSLAQLRVIDQIQRIAIGLGLKVEPPLIFERRIDATWTPLSNKHHIQLAATVCYIYANRKKTIAADAVVNKEKITFHFTTVQFISMKIHHGALTMPQQPQPNQTQYTLRCQQACDPIRMRINRSGWNPFPNMIFAAEEDH